MAGKAQWCWLCQVGELTLHCASPGCSWHRCPKCGVTFNPHTLTAVDSNWRPVEWPPGRHPEKPKEST